MNARRFFLLLTSGILALKSILSARAEETAEEGLRHMKQVVRNSFPGVRQLSSADLAAWLADTNRVQPVLLDVRTHPEFMVSHLRGAWQIDPKTPATDTLNTLPLARPVVVYCSVGYRSSEYAARMIKEGFTNVVNLEGSLFQWANEGRPLSSNGQPAALVHPYNATFGKLLKPELRPARWETAK